MKWNEIFRTRKLLKRLISMSLCIGMAGGQLLSGIPIQAEEQTDESTYALPTDTKINPNITIQHYYHFPNMDLGNIEEDFGGKDKYYDISQELQLRQYLSGVEASYTGPKPVVVWNTSLRNGKTPSNVSWSLFNNQVDKAYELKRDLDPKNTVKFSDNDKGEVRTIDRLYKLFEDEPVQYLTKPQMRYMNKLYNGSANASAYNANYSLKEVWLKKDSTNKDRIEETDFLVLQAPQMEVDGIMRHDPSKFIFTNNENNANLTKEEKGIHYGEDLNTGKKTVLVTEDMVIRLVFEPTTGTTDIQDVDFFDYDISDGWLYTNKKAADDTAKNNSDASTIPEWTEDDLRNWINQHPNADLVPQSSISIASNTRPYAKMKVSLQSKFPEYKFFTVTNKQGINSSATVFAFGNNNTKTGLGLKEWKGYTLNSANKYNRFGRSKWSQFPDGVNYQGATFDLAEGFNSDGSLKWSEGVNAPAIFSTETQLTGKTVFKGLPKESDSTAENYSLTFSRRGGTYTLQKVNRDDTQTVVADELDLLPPCSGEENTRIRTNEFWPMDAASTFGQDGHDLKFGSKDKQSQRAAYGQTPEGTYAEELLPYSDSYGDHNAYFGMKTQIPFVLEDGYCAPLRYFFYGDDDLFVFLSKTDSQGNIIEGTTKKVVDLGGVHSSYGMFVNLWDFIDDKTDEPIAEQTNEDGTVENIYAFKKKNVTANSRVSENETENSSDTKQNYVLSIFYTERGASGSSCYMRFSVPFEGLSMEETAMNGQIQVEKEVRYSLQNEEPSTENQDQYVYQLTLQNPEGEDLNNQYEILIYNLDENGNRKEGEVSRGYIAPNGTFRITNKQQALITGLPRSGPDDNLSTSKYKGYYYEVKELGTYDKTYTNSDYSESDDTNLKNLRPISPNTSTTFLSGTIEKGLDLEQGKYQEGYAFSSLIKDQNYVRFINAEDPGVIKLKKVVDPQIETDTDFTFNITLTNAETSIKTLPYILNRANPSQGQSDQELGTKTSDEGKEGQFEFKLKKDDELILYNLPVGTKYEIKEAQAKTASEQFEVKEIQFSGKYVPDGETNSKSVVRGIIQASTDNTKPEIGVTFVNEYHKIAEVNIPVQKFVTGEAFAGDESYTFEITSDTEGAPMPEKTQINVAGLVQDNGTAMIAADNVYKAEGQFGPIVFDDTMESGKYTYTIHEIAGKEDNVLYDVNKYHVTVKAVIGDDGTVTVESITAIDDAGNPIGDPLNDLIFVNDKVQPVQVNIPVEKIFNGRNITDQDVFTFRISEEEMSNNPKRLNALLKEKKNTIDVKQGENGELNGNFTLGDFGLEDVGKTYKFLIDEVVGSKPLDQVEYDTHKELIALTFTLEPTADNASQHIVSHLTLSSEENTPKITENNPITFTNTYHAVDQIVIPVQKVLHGRNLTDDDRFVFEISAEANTPMPEQTRLTIAKNDLLKNSENIAQKQFIIPLTDEHIKTGDNATYTYTIKELKGNDTNIQYDVATTYTITVKASNTTENGITSTIAVVDENGERQEPAIAKFENTHYEPISASIPIRKVLNGREEEAGDIFTFQIRGNDDASQAKIKTPSKVDINLSKENTNQFNIGEFTLEDVDKEYRFVLEEQKGDIEQLDYDTSKITVKVTFELKDTDDGSKTIVPVIQRVEGENPAIDAENPVVFTNTYRPTGTLKIPVTKTLEGRSFTNGDRFLFEITGEEGAPLPAQTILSVLPTTEASVESLFGPITYTEENVGNTYLYTVKEISTGLSGIKYDEAKYEVKVNVTKNDKGEIIPNAIYNNGTINVNEIKFVNHYDPEVVVKLPVMKTLEGRTMTDSDKFVFDLNGEGSAPMPEHNQVTVQGKGDHTAATTFDPIVFKNEGTYKYRITEHQGSIEHIQYSKVEYTVTVNIAKDPVSGALTSSYSMVSSAAPDVTSDTAAFVNVYQPSGTWRPSVTKELLGAELKDQAYSFEMTVTDDGDNVIYQKEAQNSADGSVDFPLVQFNTVGNYTAVIKEEALPAGSAVQYDTDTIEYTLNVEDHDGELVVTQNPPEPFVFTNDAGLRISKQLIPGSGQTLDENDLNYDFPFEVQFSDNMASKTLHAKRNGKEETLTVSADAKVNFKLKHDDTLIIYDIPKNTAYSVSENSGSKWIDKYLQIDTIGDSNGTFSNGVEASVTFRNLKPSTDDVVISGFKTMDPNGDPYPMQAGLYSFKISADGQSTTSRNLNKESEFVPEEEPLDGSSEIHRSSLPELDINDDEEDPVDSQTEEPEIPAPADSQQKRKLTMIRREAETKAAPEDTPLPDDPIAKNNEFGRFEFGKIVFTTPGIYTYRIEELPSAIPGMKHDTRIYKAEITVVEDNGSVKVHSIQYLDMNNNKLDNNRIVFVNTYSETQKPKLEIHKEQSRNFEPFTRETQTVNAGDLVTYRLTVINTGDALAKNVMIHDSVPVPEGDGDAQLTLLKSSLINNVTLDGNKITWSIGDLAPGTSYSVSFQVQVPKVKSATSWKNIATTTTDSPLDEKPDPSEEVTIESEPAKPDVTIRKYESTPQSGRYDGTESLEVKSGELVTYDMIVTNSGNEDATKVVVTDEVPDGLEFVQAFDGGSYDETNRKITWNVGTLAANGGTAIVSFQVRVPVVNEDKEWPNIAVLTHDEEEPKNSNEVKINTIVKNLEIEKLQAINHGPLTKDLQAVKAGDVVTYALHITNPGDHTIDNASVRDTVPDGLELILSSIKGGNYNPETHEITWELGVVEAQKEKQVIFSVRVPKVDQKTSWKNIATLIYDNEKPKDSNEVVVGTDLPNLTIVKDQKLAADPDYTFEKRTGQTGDTLTYRLTVTNTGTATARDVVIEDTIPTAELMETPLFLRFVSASDNGEFNERTQTITWSIGDVAPGQSRSVTFTVTIPGVKQNTLWINKAYTHYENNPDNPDEGEPKDIPSNEVKVDTMVPAVILEKEHKLNDGDRVTSLLHGNAQDTVTYYLKATNTSMATAHDVWIKDTIPTHENGALVLKEVDETYAHELNEETGEIVWKIGDLAPGEEKEVWFSVTVPEVQEATRWRNIASVSHQEDTTVPREEIETPPVEVEVLVPELEIVKRQAKNDGSLTQGLIQANAGDTITYAIEVTNTGTGPAQNIVVEDIVPEGLELVNGSISDQGQNRGGKITWNMASLEAGKAKTFTFKVKVPSVKEYTRWANVATVSDEDDPDPKPTPPVEVETEAPHLTVEKSQKRNEGNRTKDKLSVVGKDRVTYFIKVTNDGQADAKDVVVSDVVPEGLILVDGSVSDSGLVEKGVISWQLGTLAAGASRTVSFAVDVPESEGVWKNIAEAIESTHPKEPTPSNEVEIDTPKEEPNITIEKLQAQNDAQPSKTRIKARVDDTITYVLRVQNRGKETVRDIVVKDAIPQGLRFVSGSISKEGTIENGVVSWKIEELAPDQIVDLTFQVKVPVVTRNSAWINVGVLIHDDKQTPSNEVTVSIEPETPASSKNGKPTSPNTAAETNHMIWLGALMISVLVLAVLWKRKKNISH